MKRIFGILFFILTIAFAGNEIQAGAGNKSDKIALNKVSKTLIAPEASHYQWYFNGRQLQAINRKIKIVKPGTYKVEMADEKGITKSLSITVALNSVGDPMVVYTIGDSTVQDYTDYYYPQTGWGQVLQLFFDADSVIINNEAVGGTSSKSFYDSFWPAIRSSLDSGNFVFIGFGINDNNPTDPARYTIAETPFKADLTKFVEETQAAGAYPVIVSTVRRNAWLTDSTVYDAYHGYPVASRELAAELNVPLIDLDAKSKVLMEELSQQYCTYYWYMHLDAGEYPTSGAYSGGRSDDVHFQEMGAIEMARLVTEEIRDLSDDPNVSTLIPHLKEMHQVTVTPSIPEYAGLITRTASYPEGANITLKVRPETGAVLTKWSSGTVDSITNEKMIQFTMGTEDLSYTAYFFYPPRLEITSPKNGDELELGRDIELNVFAHDVSDTNSQVIIYDGATEIARIDTAPYTDTLKGIGSGTHTLVAKAYDINGELMESPAVVFTVDNGYPKITLDEPAGDVFYELADTITLVASAYDANGTVSNVTFYVNNESVAELTDEPYLYKLPNPGAGIYSIYAAATDNDGNVTNTGAVTAEIGPMVTFQENEDGYCGITNNAGTIDTNHLDYTGSGFINGDNQVGSTINWTVNFVDTGKYKIVFRYSATTTRPANVIINGENIGTVPFPATATFDVWDFSSVSYTATKADTMPLSLVATGSSGLPNIDYMKIITLEGSTKAEVSAECLEQPEPTLINAKETVSSFIIYPVPVQDLIRVKSFKKINISSVSILKLDGTLIKSLNNISDNFVEMPCSGLNSGLYIMRITIGTETYIRKFNIVK